MLAVIRVAVVSLTGAGITVAQPASQDKPLLAEQVFKNIHVLKGISVDDFLQTMGLMTAALEFDCADCHNNAGTKRCRLGRPTLPERCWRAATTPIIATSTDQNCHSELPARGWTDAMQSSFARLRVTSRWTRGSLVDRPR